MQQFFKLPKEAIQPIADKFGTPLLVVSRNQVKENYELLMKHIPGIKIHYAMKSNPDINILKQLIDSGSCFDVASDGEMELLAELDVAPDRIVYANPVKTWNGLNTAKRIGVYKMTYDSDIEVEKMASAVPGAQVLIRVRVDNPKALVDLNSKFGCYPEEALFLMRRARKLGLDVLGMCFHVGSQTLSVDPYIQGIETCKRLFDVAALDGFNLRVLDIGGGFPVPAAGTNFDVVKAFDTIAHALGKKFPAIEIWCEPGRYICGTAVNLLTSVIANIIKNDKQWYFLDEGIYGSFSAKMFDHWEFSFETNTYDRPEVKATFAGPSCDSIDVVLSNVKTPRLEMNDVLLFPIAGAYTAASASSFNGFRLAKSVCWEDIENTI
ncbi:MAG: type III PLP-dependent enzyme [Negativicutes bacterium]|jgi:ornithine decarboxylase